MYRLFCPLVLCIAAGCGGNPSATPSASNSSTQPTEAQAAETGKPSAAEAISGIREYFSDPGVGFSNVQVEKVSGPVSAPKEALPAWGDVWVFSVTMNCSNVVGCPQQNKNWLVLMNRENGRATVKDHYHNLERVAQSPLGKDWFARTGFAEPVVVHQD